MSEKYWPENLQDSGRIVNFALAKAKWFHVRVVRYRSAKPFTPVRIWLEPQEGNSVDGNRWSCFVIGLYHSIIYGYGLAR